MDFLSEARELALQSGGGASGYVNMKQCADGGLVFSIVDVQFREKDSPRDGKDRWHVFVVPYYDDDAVPQGDLTFTQDPQNGIRRSYFEAIQMKLAEMEDAGEQPEIGPAALVKLRTKSGSWFYEIVGVNPDTGAPILPAGAVLYGTPKPGEPSEAVRRPLTGRQRPQTPPAQVGRRLEPATAQTQPTAAEAMAAPTFPPADRPASGPGRQQDSAGIPTVREWAAKQPQFKDILKPRGRVPAEIMQAYEHAMASGQLTDPDDEEGLDDQPYQGTAEEVEEAIQQQAQRMRVQDAGSLPGAQLSRSMSGADPKVVDPHRYINPGEPAYPQAASAQQQEWDPNRSRGVSLEPCPHCGQKIEGRAFPEAGTGGMVLIHNCPQSVQPQVLPAQIVNG